MKLNNFLFVDEHNPKWIQLFIFVLLVGYGMTTAFFFLWNSLWAGLVLTGWWFLTGLLYGFFRTNLYYQMKAKMWYIPLVFVLAIIEESLMYWIGGALGGTATSLWHTLSIAVPIFAFSGVAILLLYHWMGLDSGDVFLIGAGFGFVVEIVLSGHHLLLIGGGIGIYAMMFVAPMPRKLEAVKRSPLKRVLVLLFGITLCFFFGGNNWWYCWRQFVQTYLKM
ncbi:hypothetical protein GEMRC1_001823 [Eukaryota sp. GEM-RC1]